MSIPIWIKSEIRRREGLNNIKEILRNFNLHTVCEEARCPNIGKCFHQNTLTFLILGDVCTRNCSFCAVKKGIPEKVNIEEPENISEMVLKLNLDYVVLTSVTRDDLEDGGAEHFVNTIRCIRKKKRDIKIEVLIPDFNGNMHSLYKIFDAKPDVINHNLETVSSFYRKIRPKADYKRSLEIIKISKLNGFYTKTGIMLGIGENENEVKELIKDISLIECDIFTIGQYLSPSKKHYPVYEYIHPDKFEYFKDYAKKVGIKIVVSGPLVRSSYMAKECYERLRGALSQRKG